mmetsp:Transcript_16170/g.40564  ORF Transcript_16170/g.40564 Transcript_16170/m.40564 type:complete len:546 (-) Transcript_16170:259-1896(-)|eukprot:CAMPEP_0116091810 /NCGR_PEP_ID=MMETSP0327-20121206/7703_1 /TAXON_ID=44447 /ORGANISM="Pseudo-nitzschia delicatissima, Strain B596" /LENGTH=545 /DNA_ID=CAMNT_0003583185 /DNA_START=368 /DNA_END=2005 /DNA_ORIENTATION=+
MDDHEFHEANEGHVSSNKTNGNVDFHDQTLDQPAHHHPSTRSQLLTVSFNQDGGCLAVGTANGFSVHNLHPQYNLSVERMLRGGIGQIEMLFRCNLMALVGGGSDPHAAPHRVLIWDDHLPKEIGELSFRQIVLRVKLRKDAIAVALRDRVYVYHLADLSLRDKIYTADNPYGLLSLSTHVQDMVLACPSVTKGHVRVELYGLRKTMLIEAHESTLRALVLTADGGKLATASHKGTIVRVWDVATSQNIYEFRRGVERANITCLAFSWDDQWISCSSDKGTTHIFYLENEKDKNNKKKNGSASSYFGSTGSSLLSSGSRLLMGSLSSSSKAQPKSVCQIRGIPHPLACAFIADAPHLIAVAGWDADGNGVLLISEFAAHQEARRVAYHVLVKNTSTADESEEERRRRRARGWVPSEGNTNIAISADVDDARMHFGHLRISDAMAEESQRFQTQTTEDDFCEVIVRPREEPIIEDKPPDQVSNDSSAQKQQQQSSEEPKKDNVTENENGDVFAEAKESEDEIDDDAARNTSVENGKDSTPEKSSQD